MKRIVLLIFLILSLTACTKTGNKSDMPPVLHDGYSMTADSSVDCDLTVLSSTMVYAEVNAMMTQPEEYEGKTVKINGAMSAYTDEESQITYYACIIKDATACCAQGFEFLLADENATYPQINEDITVKGIFETYEENGYYYCRLRDAELI